MAEGLLNTEAVHEESRESGTLALSADDFSALEERVMRAVSVVRRERQARAEADERAAQAEARAVQAEARASEIGAQIGEHSQHTQRLEQDIKQLHAERDHVRQRVERLLKQLDAIEV